MVLITIQSSTNSKNVIEITGADKIGSLTAIPIFVPEFFLAENTDGLLLTTDN